jgi:outer membrane protein assembly factor BamB
VTDGEHVIAFFGSQGLYCYSLDGEAVWDKDLGDMKTRNGFGEGASPALHDDIIVVLWDTEEESYVVAIDKLTGKQLWKQDRDERTGWTTPYVQPFGNGTQVIINGTTAVRSYDLKTGELLWQCSGQTVNAIPSIVSDGKAVYATSGYHGNAAMAIRLGARGDLTDSDAVLWTLNRGTPYVPSPLLVDGLLVFCQRNDAILTCVDAATGQVYYSQERLEGVSGVYASPVGVQDRIYLPGQNGATAVLAKSKELKVLAINQLDEPINASPVVVGDELLLRGRNHLYCIASERP